jgi:hypothetical protein
MVGKLWEGFISKWIFLPLYGLIVIVVAGSVFILWMISKEFPFYVSYILSVAILLVVSCVVLFSLCCLNRYAVIFLFGRDHSRDVLLYRTCNISVRHTIKNDPICFSADQKGDESLSPLKREMSLPL